MKICAHETWNMTLINCFDFLSTSQCVSSEIFGREPAREICNEIPGNAKQSGRDSLESKGFHCVLMSDSSHVSFGKRACLAVSAKGNDFRSASIHIKVGIDFSGLPRRRADSPRKRYEIYWSRKNECKKRNFVWRLEHENDSKRRNNRSFELLMTVFLFSIAD